MWPPCIKAESTYQAAKSRYLAPSCIPGTMGCDPTGWLAGWLACCTYLDARSVTSVGATSTKMCVHISFSLHIIAASPSAALHSTGWDPSSNPDQHLPSPDWTGDHEIVR